jgi:hypothetical protein
MLELLEDRIAPATFAIVGEPTLSTSGAATGKPESENLSDSLVWRVHAAVTPPPDATNGLNGGSPFLPASGSFHLSGPLQVKIPAGIQVQLDWSETASWDLDPVDAAYDPNYFKPDGTQPFIVGASDQASATLDLSAVGAQVAEVKGGHTTADIFDHSWDSADDPKQGTVSFTTPVEKTYSIDINASGNSTGTWVGGSGAFHGKAAVDIELKFHVAPDIVWTGKGANNLWSNGDNWLSGVAPIAGADLLFPAGAQQLSNVDDLGFTFGSITIGDSYQFSGQPLMVTGAFDVQQGSIVLNTSATLDGTSTIEQGASLAIGAAHTLTANSNLSVLGKAIVGNAGNFTLGPSGILNLLNGGGFDTSGITTLLGQTSMATGSNWAAHTPSTTLINGAFTTDSKLKFDNGSKLSVALNMSLLANSTCDIDGDWSVSEGASLSAAAGCSLAANGKFALLGKATFDKNSSFTLGVKGDLNVGATGALDYAGTANFLGNTSTASGSSLHAEGTSNTVIDAAFKTAGNTKFDNGSNLSWNANFRGKVVEGGTLTTSGNTTSNLNSVLTVDGNALWRLPSGSNTYLHATVNNVGKCEVDAGANLNQYDLSVFKLAGELDCNGKYTLSAAVNPVNGPQLIFSDNGKLLDHGGQVNVGVKDKVLGLGFIKVDAGASFNNMGLTAATVFIEGDATTVAAGATLDVSRTLTVAPGGHLDVFGTVTIEPGATVDAFSRITVERGGVIVIPGAFTIHGTGSLDIFGTVIIEPGSAYSPLGTVTVEPAGTLTRVAPSVVLTPRVGSRFSQVVGVGGAGPYHFSVTSGALPPGVILNPATGMLSGIPQVSGTFHFVVTATDSGTGTGSPSATQAFTLTVRSVDPARVVLLAQPGKAPLGGFLAPLQVQVRDGFGNPVSGVVVRLTLVPIVAQGPPGFTAGSVVQAMSVNGVAMFSRVAIAARGRYRLRAEVGGVAVFSDAFNVGLNGRRSD